MGGIYWATIGEGHAQQASTRASSLLVRWCGLRLPALAETTVTAASALESSRATPTSSAPEQQRGRQDVRPEVIIKRMRRGPEQSLQSAPCFRSEGAGRAGELSRIPAAVCCAAG